MRSVGLRNKFVKGCPSIRIRCFKWVLDTTVTIVTKAHTPFFLSGPWFSFRIHRHLTIVIESWLEMMITAARSEEKSATGMNCLEHYNVHESIFKTSNFFSKSVPGVSRKDSIIVNLVQLERKRPVQIRIKVLTRSKLWKTKSQTIIDLEWTSDVSLSRDISGKTISLPGILRSVTFETLSFVKNYTINVHWIPDLFSRKFYKSYQGFCNEDVLRKTKHNYCLNYTSI